MESLRKSLSLAALLFVGAQAYGDMLEDKTCIKPLETAKSYSFGPSGELVMDDGSATIHKHQWIEVNDEDQFYMMGQTEKEFSVPHSLQVCANDQRVFGLQLTTAMTRMPYEKEDFLIEKFGVQEYIQWLDGMIARSLPRRMNFIGGTGYLEEATCITLKFFDHIGDYAKLDEVLVYTDSTGVRSLRVILVHTDETLEDPIEVLQFGQGPAQADETKFEFWNGKQMLGIGAQVQYDNTGVSQDRLMGLHFYSDECARTQQLYMTGDMNLAIAQQEWTPEKSQLRKHPFMTVFGIALIIYMTLITSTLCYCAIKNRGKIMASYKSAGASGQTITAQRANEADVTPANIPRQPDDLSVQV